MRPWYTRGVRSTCRSLLDAACFRRLLTFPGGTLNLHSLRERAMKAWSPGSEKVSADGGHAGLSHSTRRGGRVAYSIVAPRRSVSIEGSSCVIRGPRGTVQVGAVG